MGKRGLWFEYIVYKKDIKMVYKYMKKCFILLIIREL